ncbi:tenascin-R-like [Convolutriloba macropyga]|uniref:tenascin-R-like n=1 Tax=Convolutriloba macropyga TaxID=536237 RepID=UPI003F5262F9
MKFLDQIIPEDTELSGLTDGETVDIQLVTYRGISDHRTIFIGQNAEERLSAVLITPGQNSVQVFWTALPSVVAANVSAIRVELTLKPQPVHNRFFSTNEVMTQTLELTDTGTFADSVTIGDLVRGVEYEVAVKVIGQGGDEMTSLTTNLNFNTDPPRLFIDENVLRLGYDRNSGLKLQGILTKFTLAQQMRVKATLLQEKTSLDEESICSIEECLNNDESREFEFTFFQSETVKPGTQFSVQIAATSGPFQSAQMSIDHFEKPLPVSDVRVTYFDTNTVKLLWNPPSKGYFRAFKIHVTDETGSSDTHLRDVEPVFTAAGLTPGMQYHFSIITSADDEGAVESSPVAITQDTAA